MNPICCNLQMKVAYLEDGLCLNEKCNICLLCMAMLPLRFVLLFLAYQLYIEVKFSAEVWKALHYVAFLFAMSSLKVELSILNRMLQFVCLSFAGWWQ